MEKDFYIICALVGLAFLLAALTGPVLGMKAKYIPWMIGGVMAAATVAGFRAYWAIGATFLMLGAALTLVLGAAIKQIQKEAAAKKEKKAAAAEDKPDATSHQL